MTDIEQLRKELAEIRQALTVLTQGSSAHKMMMERAAEIEAQLTGSGAIAQNNSTALGQQAVMVDGDFKGGNLNTGTQIGTQINIIASVAENKTLPFPAALRHYLESIITAHQNLRLQGIRVGSQPLSVALEKVYVSLTAVDKHPSKEESDKRGAIRQSGFLTISDALKRYRRLVVIGDPGCGKTTLLYYIALTYARSLRELMDSSHAGDADVLQKRLQLNESGSLPILLPLRSLSGHLKDKHSDPGKDGPALLLNYLFEYFQNQNILLPHEFFNHALEEGNAVLLLDGMDEVAETRTRQRVARLIEKFSDRYPRCRFIVTSREVGYKGAVRIGADFGLAKVRDFSEQEVRQFLIDWTRVVECALAGSEAPEILHLADDQSDKLIKAIAGNPRVADLAVNPLLLTVIALVHRYRAQLPERRSELYEEAVEVLLGHWDAAKGMETEFLLAGGRMLDGGDRRALLEPVAFWLHEHKKRELDRDDLRAVLMPKFVGMMSGSREQAAKSLDSFLHLINERSGLLIERGVGVYGFAHLTFQEYLAARVLAERGDALKYSLRVLSDGWWREVILLEAGYLSNQGSRRVSALIRAILNAEPKAELEPHHNLLLAAECLFDVGAARVEGDLLGEARKRLKKQANATLKKGNKASVLAKITASNALARLESGHVAAHFWKTLDGEPEWITIPEGSFWLGEDKSQYDDERPQHGLNLYEYQIARVPITNAQFALYVKEAKTKAPEHWRGGDVPPGLENHPVVNVTWYDALSYCNWLGKKIRKTVKLPSEAEWEKAAKGGNDKRNYPWGDVWHELHCNSDELGLKDTTPVGLFLNGATIYGVLDMSGNVWEWTRSLWGKDFSVPSYKYPYNTMDKERENLNAEKEILRVLRGGSFYSPSTEVRCAFRLGDYPDRRNGSFGFRVVSLP